MASRPVHGSSVLLRCLSNWQVILPPLLRKAVQLSLKSLVVDHQLCASLLHVLKLVMQVTVLASEIVYTYTKLLALGLAEGKGATQTHR